MWQKIELGQLGWAREEHGIPWFYREKCIFLCFSLITFDVDVRMKNGAYHKVRNSIVLMKRKVCHRVLRH
jgi:hypothetical protein